MSTPGNPFYPFLLADERRVPIGPLVMPGYERYQPEPTAGFTVGCATIAAMTGLVGLFLALGDLLGGAGSTLDYPRMADGLILLVGSVLLCCRKDAGRTMVIVGSVGMIVLIFGWLLNKLVLTSTGNHYLGAVGVSLFTAVLGLPSLLTLIVSTYPSTTRWLAGGR